MHFFFFFFALYFFYIYILMFVFMCTVKHQYIHNAKSSCVKMYLAVNLILIYKAVSGSKVVVVNTGIIYLIAIQEISTICDITGCVFVGGLGVKTCQVRQNEK